MRRMSGVSRMNAEGESDKMNWWMVGWMNG